MRFLICDVPECTLCGECRIKAFAKGEALVLRLAGCCVEEKRLCVCLVFFGKGSGITSISGPATFDCLCSMIGCIIDAFIGR